jgi:opacity protein-like surface antigen
MKKLMIASTSLIALVGGSAVAADIPVNAPVYKSVPLTSFSWTGFYIGGHSGSGWGHKNWFEDATQSGGGGPIGFRDASYDDFSGWLGGGQLGANYQAGWVMWGVQADISGAHIIGSDNHCFPEVTGVSQTCATKIKSLGTVTGRIGAAFDRSLVYVLGGWAWARENHENFCNLCGLLNWTASETRSGWTVGVGGEYAFAGAWSAFLQYNYMNFGTRNDRFIASLSSVPPFTEDIRQNLNVVKVGVNYKFGSQAGLADSAFAVGMPVKAPPAAWSWTGYYIGVHIGSAMGINTVADPFGPSIFGDEIHSPGYFGGVQIGFNWQAPGSPWVFGLEADASLANLDGTNTCFAFSGFSGAFNSLNCRAHTDALGTLTGRVGMAFGPSGRSLAYVKGGLGWASSTVDTIVNFENFGVVLGNTSHNSFTSVGWTAGAGVEYALMPHWTVKAEYDYLDLGSTGVVAASPSILVPPGVFLDVPPTKVSQQIHSFKLGINYKFGSDTAPFPSGAFGTPILAAGAPGLVTKAAPMPVAGWNVEVGARYWYSWGRFQKDLALGVVGPQNPTLNISRLTWDNLTSHAGEGFARINTPWNIFVKGFAGAGNINGGKINDEDWLAPIVTYSNTVGNASGHLNYWTIDGGFDIIH